MQAVSSSDMMLGEMGESFILFSHLPSALEPLKVSAQSACQPFAGILDCSIKLEQSFSEVGNLRMKKEPDEWKTKAVGKGSLASLLLV